MSGYPYSIPQHFGQFNHLTVAGALGIERKLYALHAILQGDASIEHFTALADDWEIEEKAVAALNEWGWQKYLSPIPCIC